MDLYLCLGIDQKLNVSNMYYVCNFIYSAFLDVVLHSNANTMFVRIFGFPVVLRINAQEGAFVYFWLLKKGEFK